MSSEAGQSRVAVVSGSSGLIGRAPRSAAGFAGLGGSAMVGARRDRARCGGVLTRGLSIAARSKVLMLLFTSQESLWRGRGGHRSASGALARVVRAVRGLLAEASAASAKKPVCLLSASAIGIYGSRGEERLDESSLRGQGFSPMSVVGGRRRRRLRLKRASVSCLCASVWC